MPLNNQTKEERMEDVRGDEDRGMSAQLDSLALTLRAGAVVLQQLIAGLDQDIRSPDRG
jgi:hypothetical protein